MENLHKRPDSPQIRRKSWPSVPRSILKKSPNHQKPESNNESPPQENSDEVEVIKVISNNETNDENLNNKVIQDEGNSANSAATVVSARTARKRRIAGIFQHYYPEGGWGYVVLICAFFSHFLASGLQVGFLILLPFASRRYQADQTQVGKQNFKIHLSL